MAAALWQHRSMVTGLHSMAQVLVAVTDVPQMPVVNTLEIHFRR